MNRSVVIAIASVLSLLLVACPKKQDTPDAAADAATATTAAVPVDAPDGESPATPLPTGTPTGATAARGGATAAKVEPADAGPAMDAGRAADTCCCEVPGQPLAQVVQSECTKGKKGQCVKKEKCAAAPPVDAGPPPQQCCCDSAGKKELRGQSECTKGGAGKCVKMTDCKK